MRVISRQSDTVFVINNNHWSNPLKSINSLTERTFTFAPSPFCHSESCPEFISGSKILYFVQNDKSVNIIYCSGRVHSTSLMLKNTGQTDNK